MAKKRKQYVAHVSKARSARAALKDLAIGFVANDKGLRLVNVKHSSLERCGPSIDAALTKIRYKWTVYIAVMGRTKLNQAYIKSEVIDVPGEYLKHEISATVATIHEKLTRSVPVDQLSNVGWIALPVAREISENELGELFDTLGCWDSLAPWQDEILNNGH